MNLNKDEGFKQFPQTILKSNYISFNLCIIIKIIKLQFYTELKLHILYISGISKLEIIWFNIMLFFNF
jgi:hypothetical protein